MSKSIIIFGVINKKLLLPFFLAATEIIYLVFNKYYPVHAENLILQIYGLSLAEMSIKFLPCILKITDKEELKQKEETIKKKRCVHYTILTALYLISTGISSGADLFEYYLNDGKISYSGSNLFPNIDLILMSIEMVFMILVSICLLKYKYYKHHIISTIIILIFGIISELALGTYFQDNGKFFIGKAIRLLGTAFDASYYCFQKYMMEKFYYPYWNIAFVPGLIMFIFSSILFIIVLINPKSETPFIKTFYLYFQLKEGLGLPIGKIIIVFIIHLILCPLTILNIFYFSPNFILIIFQFSRIARNIMTNGVDKLYCIVFYVIQFFALMIHLEIIELNFCGLNKYTKRNIEFRSEEDLLFEGRDSTIGINSIEIDAGYTIDNAANNEKVFEMKEQEKETTNE